MKILGNISISIVFFSEDIIFKFIHIYNVTSASNNGSYSLFPYLKVNVIDRYVSFNRETM